MQLSRSALLVTGGASGLGAAVVRRFHAAGANVVICDVDSAAGEALAGELGERTRFARTDVSSEAEAQRAVGLAESAFGRLHGLVNCAGIGPSERVVGKSGPHRLDVFVRCVQINLIGTFNMIRLAAASMANGVPTASGERGVIVNTASIAAYEGQIGQAAYAASKAGIVGMTLPIARELARSGIRLVTIAPGLFHTPLLETLPQKVMDALVASTTFPRRLGRPDEFAALAQHIFENEMLNGAALRLDGALRMAAS